MAVISLNRAGKVKNSTPKVEKTPKERQKTGRARRRELYLKRESSGFFTNRKMRMNPQGVNKPVEEANN